MWDCKPIHTPMDPNSRLTKSNCPEVVDPILHRRYRCITGCLSYLVNMTRPDLDFAYSQLSKFVQYPGVKHLEETERVLQYVREPPYDQGINFMNGGPISWKLSREGGVTLSSENLFDRFLRNIGNILLVPGYRFRFSIPAR